MIILQFWETKCLDRTGCIVENATQKQTLIFFYIIQKKTQIGKFCAFCENITNSIPVTLIIHMF